MYAPAFFEWSLYALLAVAIVTACALFFINAPYGRHLRGGWGPTVPSTLGWILMETPAVVTIGFFFFLSDRVLQPVPIVFVCLWQIHYLYRTYVYPFRRKGGSKPMPLSVVLMAVFFNVWNGYLNGYWLFHLGPLRTVEWFADPRFVLGSGLFIIGMVINHQSDGILFRLRGGGQTGYKIPHGGLYRFVSMPNYLGELIEWIGWAIATWSLAGAAFAVFTAANLAPRALANHQWYRSEFPDYPPQRKAIIPFVF